MRWGSKSISTNQQENILLIKLTVASRNEDYEGQEVAVRPDYIIDLSPYHSPQIPTARAFISLTNSNTYTIQESVTEILAMMESVPGSGEE